MSSGTREKIMNAAKALFAENGYAAVTTKEIAKKALVSEVTVFRYFESKRNLFNAIVKEHMLNYGIADYLENEATYDARTDLLAIAERLLNNERKNAALSRMVMKDVFFKSEARTHSRHIENSEMEVLKLYFLKLGETGKIKDDPEKLMRFYISNLHSFSMRNYILRQEPMGPKDQEYLEWLIKKIVDTILM